MPPGPATADADEVASAGAAAGAASSPVSSGCEKSHSTARSGSAFCDATVSARISARQEARAYRLAQGLARLGGREAHVGEHADLLRARLGPGADACACASRAADYDRRVDVCIA